MNYEIPEKVHNEKLLSLDFNWKFLFLNITTIT